MSEKIEKYKNRLAKSRANLNAALDAAADRAEEQIYSEGAQWTLRQLVIHLAVADKGHNGMVMNYAQGNDFIPADYDIERFNSRSVAKRDEMTFTDAREALNQSRAELLEWLDQQDDDSFLEKEGRHATLQIMTVAQIFNAMAGHERLHTDDIIALVGEAE